MRLQNRTAIVTGAGSGIGRGIAHRFAAEGAQVVIAELSEELGRQAAEQIQAGGGQALYIPTDVTRRSEVEAMVRQASEAFGRLDILVNNAGLTGRARFLEMTDEEWERMISVNLTGPFLCTQSVVQEMVRTGNTGAIINIASVESEAACPDQAHYAASKGGLLMLTRALACDLAPYGIRVNAIGPGTVDSGHGAFDDLAVRTQYESRIPLGRVATPRDVANAALFLASDEAEYISGIVLFVDGGTINKYAGVEWSGQPASFSAVQTAGAKEQHQDLEV
jgi:NAD(P)-dependent dehydrogenase (short-subunit alcohol dehydrogenase family)